MGFRRNRGKPVIAQWSALPRWDYKSARAALFAERHPNFVPLGEYAEEATELIDPRKEPGKEWPIYGVNNESGVFLSTRQKGSEFNSNYKRIRKDYFFHNPTRANVGSLGRVQDVPPDAITSPEYQVWKPCPGLLPAFAEILIKTEFFLDQIECHRVGGVKERLFVQNLFEIPVPIPALPIQQKIVAHWEAAQTEANLLLSQANQLPGELEKQVLGALGLKKKKQVAMPKVMVTNWADLTKWNQRATYLLGQTPDLSKGTYPVVSGRECIAEVKHGCSASPSNKPTTLKVLKLSAVTSGQFLPSEAKFITDKKPYRENFDLIKGDILMCRTNGTLAYVGRPAILEKDYPELIFPDKLMRVRCKANVLPEYLEYILSSSIARPQLEANARTAVGNHAIGNEDVFNVELPLPPISEQEKLVKIMQEARNESGRAREEAMSLKRKAEKEIEKMILGTRPVEAY